MSSSSTSSASKISHLPKSVRWIHTLLWKGLMNPLSLDVGKSTPSYAISLNGINSILTFQLKRKNPRILTLSLNRNFIRHEPPDDDYFIKFYITLYNFKERARSGVMYFEQNTIDLDYDIQSYRRLDSQQYETLMKCLIRVVEMEDTSNLERERQEYTLFSTIMEDCTWDSHIMDMAFVLRRPNLCGIFTGRMDAESASLMSTLIASACQYSAYIYEYIRARDRSDPEMPNIPLNQILTGIYQTQQFNEYKCRLLLKEAHILGLEFLRVLCSAYLMENLNDNSMLKIIMLADWTEDTELFKAAAAYFMERRCIISGSAQWAHFVESEEGFLQSFLQSVHYRSTTGDWNFPPLPEEEDGGC